MACLLVSVKSLERAIDLPQCEADTESMGLAYQLKQIPLSESPRTRRIPQFATLAPPAYLGEFTEFPVAIVNLHGQGTYELVKDLRRRAVDLHVRRDRDNEHDENAVACYVEANGGFDLVGYLGREDAATIAPELDAGATLRAKLLGRPWSGADARGGSVSVTVYLVPEG